MLRAYEAAIRALRAASRGSYLGPVFTAEVLEEAFESTRGQDTDAIRSGASTARGESDEKRSESIAGKIRDRVSGALFQAVLTWLFEQLGSWVTAKLGSKDIEEETESATSAIDKLNEQCQHDVQAILSQLDATLKQVVASLAVINPVLHPHIFMQCVQAGAGLIDAAGSTIHSLCKQRDSLMTSCFEQLLTACECECNQPEPKQPKRQEGNCEEDPTPEEHPAPKCVSTPPQIPGGSGAGGGAAPGGGSGGSSSAGSPVGGAGGGSNGVSQTAPAGMAPAAPPAQAFAPPTHVAGSPALGGGPAPTGASGLGSVGLGPGLAGGGLSGNNPLGSFLRGSGSATPSTGMAARLPGHTLPFDLDCSDQREHHLAESAAQKTESAEPARSDHPNNLASCGCDGAAAASEAEPNLDPCEDLVNSAARGVVFGGVLGIVGVGVLAAGISWIVEQVHEHIDQWMETVAAQPEPATPIAEPTPEPEDIKPAAQPAAPQPPQPSQPNPPSVDTAPEPPPQQIKPVSVEKPAAPPPPQADPVHCEPPGAGEPKHNVRVQKAGAW